MSWYWVQDVLGTTVRPGCRYELARVWLHIRYKMVWVRFGLSTSWLETLDPNHDVDQHVRNWIVSYYWHFLPVR